MAATEIRVGVRKILDWIAIGEINAINVAARREGVPRWVIEPEEWERFKRSRSSTPAPKPLPHRRKPTGIKEFF